MWTPDDDDDRSCLRPWRSVARRAGRVQGRGEELDLCRCTLVASGRVRYPRWADGLGSTIAFSNDSEGEVHEIVLFKLPDDEERPVSELLALPQEEVGMVTGAPVGVSLAFPGEDGMVVEGDLTVEDPGRYLMICAIPTGADPQAYRDVLAAPTPPDGPPDVPGGPPHFTQGMVAELTVQ